jgi:glycosyltransferase involved in cell wall biosynthesis
MIPIYADVTRLLRRHIGGIQHSGIDRVNLEYARWVYQKGGGLCVQRGAHLRKLRGSVWPQLLLGDIQSGDSARDKYHRIKLLIRSLYWKPIIPERSRVMVSTHSWLAKEKIWANALKRRFESFVFIHDLIPISFPEYSHPREKILHQKRIKLTLANARGIIVNSHATEQEILNYSIKEQLAIPPILVAPLGYHLPELASPNLPEKILKPFFLFLGTIEPRKNHLLLLNLWRDMVQQGIVPPMLVIAGRRGWECEQVVDMLERCEVIQPYIFEWNNATDAEVAALIKGARALLFPSFAEGFGMPVQEALAVGTPVIGSPLPVFREIAGDIPEYADPLNAEIWRNLILDYAQENSTKRNDQLGRIKSFQGTRWDKHFQLVDNFLS